MTLVASAYAVRDTRLHGIALMIATNVVFAALDTTAKLLGEFIDPLQIAWFRYAVNLVLALVVMRAWLRPTLFDTRHPVLQILRGLCLLGSTAFNFAALRYLQLAEVASINFAGPLFITALAGPMLGEKIGWRRWIAVFVGFVGMMVVIRPGLGGLQPAALLSVCGILCYALYSILTRLLSRTETSEGLLLHGAIVGTVVLLPTLPPVWHTPSEPMIWVGLVALGVLGAFGHFLLIRAHKLAPASLLAPFTYLQIIWLTLSGYLVFDQMPDIWTLYGALIIIGSGLYILHRERLVRGG